MLVRFFSFSFSFLLTFILYLSFSCFFGHLFSSRFIFILFLSWAFSIKRFSVCCVVHLSPYNFLFASACVIIPSIKPAQLFLFHFVCFSFHFTSFYYIILLFLFLNVFSFIYFFFHVSVISFLSYLFSLSNCFFRGLYVYLFLFRLYQRNENELFLSLFSFLLCFSSYSLYLSNSLYLIYFVYFSFLRFLSFTISVVYSRFVSICLYCISFSCCLTP